VRAADVLRQPMIAQRGQMFRGSAWVPRDAPREQSRDIELEKIILRGKKTAPGLE
jgi:hypothetical protein